ncbi:MAG: ABC transporter ATP-binding protein [Proteobacteria bacterium]|nr:ABC transporter ATP-binding protein [Pseudomonadota bacterium]
MLLDLIVTIRRLLRFGLKPASVGQLLALTFLLAAAEGIGMGGLLPVLVYIERGAAGLRGRVDPLTNFVVGQMDRFGIDVNLAALLLIVLVPVLLRQIILYARMVLTANQSERFMANLRDRVTGAAVRADLAFFHRKNFGELSSAVTTEASRCASLVTMVGDYLAAVALILIYLAIVLYVSVELAAMMVPVIGVAGLVYWRQLAASHTLGRAVTDNQYRMSIALNEMFHGIRLIKMRGHESDSTLSLRRIFGDLGAATARLQTVKAFITVSVQPIVMIGMFGGIYWAVEWRGLGLSEIGLFIFMLTRIVPQVSTLNTCRITIADTGAAFDRLERLVAEARASAKIRGGTRPFGGLRREIRFIDVSFGYESGDAARPALRGVTLVIRRGETVALVGRSGAGKSTTVDLLPRLLEPEAGRILIDDTPIEEFELDNLRRAIAFVTQDTILFDDTIRANLSFGLIPPPAEPELWRALDSAHAADFVRRMERGLDTVVGERGVRLSGGQRQRLALARALAQGPDILVLDEPTSALDSESEAAVQAALDGLRGRLTIIVIAHRLATIRPADRIIVIEDGRTIAEGTHDTLMQGSNAYRRMFEMQTSI